MVAEKSTAVGGWFEHAKYVPQSNTKHRPLEEAIRFP